MVFQIWPWVINKMVFSPQKNKKKKNPAGSAISFFPEKSNSPKPGLYFVWNVRDLSWKNEGCISSLF